MPIPGPATDPFVTLDIAQSSEVAQSAYKLAVAGGATNNEALDFQWDVQAKLTGDSGAATRSGILSDLKALSAGLPGMGQAKGGAIGSELGVRLSQELATAQAPARGFQQTGLLGNPAPVQDQAADPGVRSAVNSVLGTSVPADSALMTFSFGTNQPSGTPGYGAPQGETSGVTGTATIDLASVARGASQSGADVAGITKSAIAHEMALKTMLFTPADNGSTLSQNTSLTQKEAIADGASALVAPTAIADTQLINTVGAFVKRSTDGVDAHRYDRSASNVEAGVGSALIALGVPGRDAQGSPSSDPTSVGTAFLQSLADKLRAGEQVDLAGALEQAGVAPGSGQFAQAVVEDAVAGQMVGDGRNLAQGAFTTPYNDINAIGPQAATGGGPATAPLAGDGQGQGAAGSGLAAAPTVGYAPGADLTALRYVASYPDLIGAVGDNAAAARTHYDTYGASEGRAVTFDPRAYLAAPGNGDLAKLADARGLTGLARDMFATQHYIDHGAQESRNTQ